ncbi:hypothetical protein EZS27_033395, partial [termite gut metagenome]
MNKLFTLVTILLLFTSCGNNDQKRAAETLALAREAFALDNYNEAKRQIDSIKILYPKAFEARKEGIRMMRQIDLKEQQQGL